MSKVLEHELQLSYEEYVQHWQALLEAQKLNDSLGAMKPIAVGWKVATIDAYNSLYQDFRTASDRIVETWMNGRWIAKMHLRELRIGDDIEIVKLMQRRPGSDDAVGLDHVDFLCSDITKIEAVLQAQNAVKWS